MGNQQSSFGGICILEGSRYNPQQLENERNQMTDNSDSFNGLDGKELNNEFTRRAKSKMDGPNPHRPTHTLYFVRERGDEQKSAWDRIGIAWTNRDGSLSCKIDCIPINGRFQIRKNE